MSGPYRLGIDIGGTFTDLALLDESSGDLTSLKVPSVPSDPARAVSNGIGALVEQHGLDPAAVVSFVHGTTLAVNTIIQRSGAPTGMLITDGFRDVLELARLRLPDPTNFFTERPKPLVPRKHVKEIPERTLASGHEYQPLDESAVIPAVEELLGQGIRAVAISFLHSYKNPDHERRTAELIRQRWPELYICTSSEVWPQQREYERSLVTVMNAYLGERLADYFEKLERDVKALGVGATVLSTKSNGGVMSAASARRSPVETLLSGPASGVIGAAYLGKLVGRDKLITLDMGGTSADVAVIDGEVHYSTENLIGDFPVIMPAVDVTSIGAGGGSIAWTDSAGVLKVGPRSAGADPGPACYGRGGTEPAVTDAYITLGVLDPAHFLGGAMQLRPDRAEAALAQLGRALELDAVRTAASVVQVTTANMYSQFTPLMARKGVDPRDFTLVAYGGAGPTHAFLLAQEVGIKHVIVPPSPGTLCALGCLVMDAKSDFIKTLYVGTDRLDEAALEMEFVALEQRARNWLAEERIETSDHYLLRTADMRYRGQSFEINVRLPASIDDLGAVVETFHSTYNQIYGYNDLGAPIEVVNIRSTIVGVTHKPDLRPAQAGRNGDGSPAAPSADADRGTRRVFYETGEIEARVYDRTGLAAGATFDSPAIVEQYDTTTFVPPGWRVNVDRWGNLVAEAS